MGGTQEVVKRYSLTNAAQWAAITNQAYDNANLPRQPYANALPAGIDTDWQREFLKKGSVQSYDLGLSGGGSTDNGGATNYNLSGGYYKQLGTIDGPRFERYSARVNTGLTNGKLRIGESLLLTHTDQTKVNGLPFIDIVRMLPVIPVYDAAQPGGFGLSTPNAVSYGTNPIGSQKLNVNTSGNNRLQGSLYGEYSFVPWLRYRLNLATEYLGFHDRSKNAYGLLRYSGDPTVPSSYAENQGNNFFGQAENTLTFDKSFGQHNVTALVGYSQQYFQSEFTRGVNFGYGTGPTSTRVPKPRRPWARPTCKPRSRTLPSSPTTTTSATSSRPPTGTTARHAFWLAPGGAILARPRWAGACRARSSLPASQPSATSSCGSPTAAWATTC